MFTSYKMAVWTARSKICCICRLTRGIAVSQCDFCNNQPCLITASTHGNQKQLEKEAIATENWEKRTSSWKHVKWLLLSLKLTYFESETWQYLQVFFFVLKKFLLKSLIVRSTLSHLKAMTVGERNGRRTS